MQDEDVTYTYRIEVEFQAGNDRAAKEMLRWLPKQFMPLGSPVLTDYFTHDIEVWDVVLVSVGQKKIQTIKEVRAFAIGMGLKDAKDLVDLAGSGSPQTILRGEGYVRSKKCAEALEETGCTVRFERTYIPAHEVEAAKDNLVIIAKELS